MPYVVRKPLKCDGVRYQIGDQAPRLSADEKRRLIALGVIELVAREEPEEAEQPKPTRKELLAKAAELGLEVPARATVDELMAAIAAAEEEAEPAAGDESGLPPGVDPNLQA